MRTVWTTIMADKRRREGRSAELRRREDKGEKTKEKRRELKKATYREAPFRPWSHCPP
jgi:hypothetical protein